MEKPIDFWLRKGKAVGETKPTENTANVASGELRKQGGVRRYNNFLECTRLNAKITEEECVLRLLDIKEFAYVHAEERIETQSFISDDERTEWLVLLLFIKYVQQFTQFYLNFYSILHLILLNSTQHFTQFCILV